MIYADACMRYRQSVSASLESVSACSHGNASKWLGSSPQSSYRWGSHGNASKWPGILLGQQPTEQLTVGLRVPSSQEAEVLSGALKINTAWLGQKKKLCVNIAVSICLPLSVCLSHIYRDSTPFENKVIELYFYKPVL